MIEYYIWREQDEYSEKLLTVCPGTDFKKSMERFHSLLKEMSSGVRNHAVNALVRKAAYLLRSTYEIVQENWEHCLIDDHLKEYIHFQRELYRRGEDIYKLLPLGKDSRFNEVCEKIFAASDATTIHNGYEELLTFVPGYWNYEMALTQIRIRLLPLMIEKMEAENIGSDLDFDDVRAENVIYALSAKEAPSIPLTERILLLSELDGDLFCYRFDDIGFMDARELYQVYAGMMRIANGNSPALVFNRCSEELLDAMAAACCEELFLKKDNTPPIELLESVFDAHPPKTSRDKAMHALFLALLSCQKGILLPWPDKLVTDSSNSRINDQQTA